MSGARTLRGDTRAVSPPMVFFGVVTLVGLFVTVGAGYLIVRGPFLGGPLLQPIPLFGSLIAFVVGIVVLAWGASKAVGV